VTFWIRIRIIGSVFWIMDPDPAHFGSGFQDVNKKLVCSKFFCLFLNLGTLTWAFKDSMSLRGHKTLEIIFFKFFGLLIEGSGSGS
jgi:hypothetical protein